MTKFLLLLLSSFLLVGCSRLEMAIDWADTFALSRVKDYYDLSSLQKDQFHKEFKTILAEIVKQDFPVLAGHLEKVAASVENGELSLIVLQEQLQGGRGLFRCAFARFEPLVQRMTNEQAEKGFAKFDREFKEKYDDDMDGIDNPKKEAKKLRQKYEDWIDETTGSLTDSQEQSLIDEVTRNPAPRKRQIESRKNVHEKFVQARTDAEKRKEFIARFVTDWESLQSPAYLDAQKIYQENLSIWIHQLLQSLNEKQKKKLVKNLRARAADLIELSKK